MANLLTNEKAITRLSMRRRSSPSNVKDRYDNANSLASRLSREASNVSSKDIVIPSAKLSTDGGIRRLG